MTKTHNILPTQLTEPQPVGPSVAGSAAGKPNIYSQTEQLCRDG